MQKFCLWADFYYHSPFYLNAPLPQILVWGMILYMFGPSSGMNCAWYAEIVGKLPSAIFEV